MNLPSTIDEAAASVMCQFLSAELETAKTLTHIATTLDDSAKTTRCVLLARKAYDAILRFLPRTALTETENEEINKAVNALRSQLEALGESFEKPTNDRSWLLKLPDPTSNGTNNSHRTTDDEVQHFLIDCEQLRRDAEWMLRQNKRLMNRERRLHETKHHSSR